MGLDLALIELMTETVSLEPRTGVDKYNTISYGTSVNVKAYISRTNRRALSKEGREITSRVQVILANPALDVSEDDRLTLPDGEQPAIIEILAAKDEMGDPYYLELRG